jgi:hypothetical protein
MVEGVFAEISQLIVIGADEIRGWKGFIVRQIGAAGIIQRQ